MTWLQDDLREYEESRQSKALMNELMVLRSQLRRMQVVYRWIDLQGQLRSLMIEANREVDRPVVQEVSSGNCFTLQREDEATLTLRFNRDMFRIVCEFSACPGQDCQLELIVKPVDGNDKTVWMYTHNHTAKADEQIARSLFSALLTCNHNR